MGSPAAGAPRAGYLQLAQAQGGDAGLLLRGVAQLDRCVVVDAGLEARVHLRCRETGRTDNEQESVAGLIGPVALREGRKRLLVGGCHAGLLSL